jgi:hypothetical protein
LTSSITNSFTKLVAENDTVKSFDPMRTWFLSLQETGEYIGIRFGRIAPGATNPEWIYLPHTDVDGIGGFAQLLRQKGVELPRLPQIKHPSPPSRLALLKNLPKFVQPRQRLKWNGLEGPNEPGNNRTAPKAFAWHVFDESETTQIRRVCRKASITVNSFLLKHLAKGIRPCLADQSATIPWMIPVNMRGKVNRRSDLENHTSYVPVRIESYDTNYDVHRKIYEGLLRGDHWANWYSYDSSRILTAGARRFLIKIEKCTAEWNIGSFSNLGDWDPEGKITHPDLAGSWLFAPPVLRCQQLGAGCVTFQNRLALVIQAHPELTINPADAQVWMQNWIKEIQIDIASLLGQPITHT